MTAVKRRTTAALATVVVLAGAAALAIGLTRGGSHHVSWTPTESSKPFQAGPTGIPSFYAVNATPSGQGTVRYVDSAGWAIVYPRGFHALGYATESSGAEGAAFANFSPVPAGPGPVPANGVLLAITSLWFGGVEFRPPANLSRFPLRVPAAFRTHATGKARSADLSFEHERVFYDASLIAGPNASRADLDALARMVASISFPPARGSA
jgi:hypothetical protein